MEGNWEPFAGNQLLVRFSYVDSTIDDASEPGRPDDPRSQPFAISDVERENYSVSVQDQISLFDNFTLSRWANTTWEHVNIPLDHRIGRYGTADAITRDFSPLAHRVFSQLTITLQFTVVTFNQYGRVGVVNNCSGITPWLLWAEAAEGGFESAVWHTARAAGKAAPDESRGVKVGNTRVYAADQLRLASPMTFEDAGTAIRRVDDIVSNLLERDDPKL